jgi:Domain of unknown function (DUF5667)
MEYTPIEQKLSELKKITLSQKRRISMRTELSAYADFYSISKDRVATKVQRTHWFFLYPLRSITVSLFLLMFITGGSGYAAERTLPGDVLYPIKTHITEPLQTAFIQTEKEKALWHATLAERRLEEATTLALTKVLDPNVQETITNAFDEEVAQSLKGAQALSIQGSPDDSADIRSDLEARLTAHADILKIVTEHKESIGSTTPVATEASSTPASPLRALFTTVDTKKEALKKERVDSEATSTLSILMPVAATTTSQVLLNSTDKKEIATSTEEGIQKSEQIQVLKKLPTDTKKELKKKERDINRTQQTKDIFDKNKELLHEIFGTSTTKENKKIPSEDSVL